MKRPDGTMIFEDPDRRRWRRTLLVFAVLAAAALVTLGLVVAGFIVPPPLPKAFSLRPTISPAEVLDAVEKYSRPKYTPAQQKRMKRLRAIEKQHRDRMVRGAITGALPLPEDVVVAFTLPDDPPSLAALEKNLSQIDVVVPAWFELQGSGCNITVKVDQPTQRVLSRSDALVLPRVANLRDNDWMAEDVAKMMRSDPDRRCVVKKLVDLALVLKVDGLNIDIEALAPEDSEPLLEFLVDLRAALHAHQLRLTTDVVLYDPAYDIEYIGKVSDAVMVMAYDEHFATSKPGPVASRTWLLDSIKEMQERLPADRLVMVLGAYGYDWNLDRPEQPGVGTGIRSLLDTARAASVKPEFVPDVENCHFGYRDEDGDTHDVWFQDSLVLWNQVLAARRHNITRLGLWRLGIEDETVWTFLGVTHPPAWPDALRKVPPGRSIEYLGSGEILSIKTPPKKGRREFTVNPDGSIAAGSYLRVPSGFLVEQRAGDPRQVLLTFDDGPSEEWTPRILDLLKAERAPGLFFVIGDEAVRHPELVERAAAEGHIVANHSFSHPHLEELTPREVRSQLAATQRLIEGLTGKRTPLFRAPYTAAVDDPSTEGIAPFREGLVQGYIVVGAGIDTRDWDQPDPDAVVQQVIDQLFARKGQVLLFHDGGGDRAQTVEVLKKLIPELRRLGFEIVSLDQLLKVPRGEIVADLPLSERAISWGSAAIAYLRSWGWTILAGLFFVCTLLAILRILFLGSMTIYGLGQRRRATFAKDYEPLVTVLIPAYNEEKVIDKTIASLLASDYQRLEILVVDDGSQDATAEVAQAIAARDQRVRLLRQVNSGKAAAANTGIKEARGEIVVAVDADTLVSKGAIPKLVRHFHDPAVTAVCGNVEVGNVRGALTAFQAIEYVTSQNFDRRAFSALNCISVVPGALGAWRREAVLAAGGYSPDTLTEDADLTLTILRNGGRVVYEAEATGRTEAPENLPALLRQRFRWTYGTYQCLWKHKRAFGKGSLGWVGLPNMVLFQILFPTLSPIGDIVMALSIVRGDWQALLAGYVAFLVMDVCASVLAFALDKKPFYWLLLLLIQRFTYRQLMYYVSLKAMLAALRGARHGWRKLDRTGSVPTLPASPASPG